MVFLGYDDFLGDIMLGFWGEMMLFSAMGFLNDGI